MFFCLRCLRVSTTVAACQRKLNGGDVGFGIYGTHSKAVFLIKQEDSVVRMQKRIRATDKPRWTEEVTDAGTYGSEQLAKQAAQDITEKIT